MIRAITVISADDSPLDIELTKAPLAELIHQARKLASGRSNGYVWVELEDPTHDEVRPVADAFELPQLEVDDALNYKQRAKIDFDLATGRHFAVIKTLRNHRDATSYSRGQTSIFIGTGYAVTVSHGANADLTEVLHRIEHDDVLRDHGPFAVLYGVFDFNVDDYLSLAEAVTLDVNEREVEVFNDKPSKDLTKNIYNLKRSNIEARRAVSPLAAPALQWTHEGDTSIPEELRPYFQDIGEHLLRVLDTVEANDNLLLSMLMASTSLQDLQQNKDMRKISAWVAIAAVPTMIAGLYGMNFDNMPELHWEYGYYVVLGVLGLISFGLYRAFKKSGWL